MFTELICTPCFTESPQQEVNNNIGRRSLRSKSNDTNRTVQSSNIFPKICLFCEKKKKMPGKGTHENLCKIETLSFQDNVVKEAEILQDERILRIIFGVDLVAKEAHYHNSCRKSFSYQASAITQKQRTSAIASEKQRTAAIRKRAFDSTTSYIEAHVFNNEEVIYIHYYPLFLSKSFFK